MNSRIVSILVVVALMSVGLVLSFNANRGTPKADLGIEKIHWLTYDEGIALARAQNKKLLIDVYTDWCSWCKKMDSDVYSDKNIRDIIAGDFVAVKLNAESSNRVTVGTEQLDEAGLAKAMGVTGYPTTVFLGSGAGPITKIEGYVEAKEFAAVLHFIGEDHYKNTTFDKFKASSSSASKN